MLAGAIPPLPVHRGFTLVSPVRDGFVTLSQREPGTIWAVIPTVVRDLAVCSLSIAAVRGGFLAVRPDAQPGLAARTVGPWVGGAVGALVVADASEGPWIALALLVAAVALLRAVVVLPRLAGVLVLRSRRVDVRRQQVGPAWTTSAAWVVFAVAALSAAVIAAIGR